ncbi:MAG: ImmA/IrrE family metallo-endopeptidase [Janthinobacterium lividum]
MEEHNIIIKSGDLGNISGLIARRDSECIVGINSKQAHVRQRFTMAHEFGHYCLHSGLTSHSDSDFRIKYRDDISAEATDVEEIEANFFAACLLMPKNFLDGLNAFDSLDDDDEVKSLAKIFDVSQHAMSLRLANVYARHRPY